jgi:hypothetical protein
VLIWQGNRLAVSLLPLEAASLTKAIRRFSAAQRFLCSERLLSSFHPRKMVHAPAFWLPSTLHPCLIFHEMDKHLDIFVFLHKLYRITIFRTDIRGLPGRNPGLGARAYAGNFFLEQMPTAFPQVAKSQKQERTKKSAIHPSEDAPKSHFLPGASLEGSHGYTQMEIGRRLA